MKLLQNPVVVAVLAVLAAALVFWNVVWPLVHHPARPRRPAAAKPAQTANRPAAPKPAPAAAAPAPAAGPATNAFDLVLVRTDASRWAENPARNPFQGRNIVSLKSESAAVPAASVLTLTSVLRQTGRSVAVINRKVVGEGDTIAGYRIDKIAANQVWVQGPNGRESVGFNVNLPPPANDRRGASRKGNSHANTSRP